MTWLKTKFKESPFGYPGTLEEFIEWLGHKYPWNLRYDQLEELQGPRNMTLVALGGRIHHGIGDWNFSFKWQTLEAGPHWRKAELYIGHGDTVHHAALSGLLVTWELLTYRKSQGSLTL